MSKRNVNYELPPTRNEEALKRVKFAGGAYKHHKRTTPDTEPLIAPQSLSDRKEATLDRLDRAGVRPYKNLEKTRVRRKVLATAVGTLAFLGGSYGIGRIAPEGSEPRNPGNMEQFSNDSLQDDYRKDPDDYTVKSGQIVNKAEYDLIQAQITEDVNSTGTTLPQSERVSYTVVDDVTGMTIPASELTQSPQAIQPPKTPEELQP